MCLSIIYFLDRICVIIEFRMKTRMKERKRKMKRKKRKTRRRKIRMRREQDLLRRRQLLESRRRRPRKNQNPTSRFWTTQHESWSRRCVEVGGEMRRSTGLLFIYLYFFFHSRSCPFNPFAGIGAEFKPCGRRFFSKEGGALDALHVWIGRWFSSKRLKEKGLAQCQSYVEARAWGLTIRGAPE